jgi:hypothetical protein
MQRRVVFNGLHDIISQKIEFFITTAERTSNNIDFIKIHYGRFSVKLVERNYWIFGLCPSSGILDAREHDVSETGSVSVLR